MNIGLVGEAPSDTSSIQNLLERKYSDVKYFAMLNGINGSMLDNQKTKRLLRIEYEQTQPQVVVFIRDLDGLITEQDKIDARKKYFTEFNSVVDKKGILLLNIYEIEALIFADVDSFNVRYSSNIQSVEDPSHITDPKGKLKLECKKYKESENPEIFKILIFDKLLNCSYFKEFCNKFEKSIHRPA